LKKNGNSYLLAKTVLDPIEAECERVEKKYGNQMRKIS
jgi:hypothetical protein